MPFSIALSGLNAASADLAVTGNNIANAETTGFKESRAEFVDVYAIAYQGMTATTPGSGVRLAGITQEFSQGDSSYTGNSLDLMINGQGFFQVQGVNGDINLTRSGAFHLDRTSTMVNSGNQALLAYNYNNVTDSYNLENPQPIRVNADIGMPAATEVINGQFNLPANETPIDPVAIPFLATDQTTYHNATASTVYDSLGNAHTATIYFRKVIPDAANTWESYTYVNGNEVVPTGLAPGDPAVITFNSAGQLASVVPSLPSTPNVISYQGLTLPGPSADPLALSLDLTDSTQYGSAFATNDLTQDGYGTGRLSGIDIDDSGVIFARYTNGVSDILGKVALASVNNPSGLRQTGDSNWAETYDSGNAINGEALNGDFGSISAGTLESSNVDIAKQLVNLIIAQRNYQANAQVISTANTVTQTIINMR